MEQVVSKDETVVVQQVVEQMMKEQEAAEKKADIQSIFSRKCTVKDPVSNLWFHEDVETDDDIKFGDNLGGDVVDEGQQRNRDQKPAEQEVEQGMGKEETVVGQKVVEQVVKKEEALMSDSYKYLKKDKDGTVECPT